MSNLNYDWHVIIQEVIDAIAAIWADAPRTAPLRAPQLDQANALRHLAAARAAAQADCATLNYIICQATSDTAPTSIAAIITDVTAATDVQYPTAEITAAITELIKRGSLVISQDGTGLIRIAT